MKRLLLGALLVTACATPSPDARRDAEAEELARFSSALAHAGMSVPLPPRRCEEPRGALRWDDEVGCLDGVVDDRRAALASYARALVRERVGSKPAARAVERGDELVDAFLHDDARFASLALALERDFDARRAGAAATAKAPAAKKAVAVEDKAAVVAAADEGRAPPASDAGPAAAVEPVVDAGVALDAGVVLSVRDRLVGTWVVELPGPVLNVYHLCADGRASVKPESSVAAIAELIADMPATSGTWEVSDAEPPTIKFTWSGGEPLEGQIRSLSAESVTIDYGDETVTATRRSTSASCE